MSTTLTKPAAGAHHAPPGAPANGARIDARTPKKNGRSSGTDDPERTPDSLTPRLGALSASA